LVILISFSVTRLLINGCYYAPLAKVVKSFPLNMIRKINALVTDQFVGNLITISSHSRPYKTHLK
ncbi:MAG TPA: hypothetical protein PLM99_06170, partial [Candidatus Cloacimonadota bacterium]|nr:hypothetical protein [Candidatus Cloacimonadota bacterium]